jgi:hypothetical protein
VTDVPDTTVTPVAAVPPKLTAVAPVKPVPVMVTVVAPPVGPVVGLMLVTTGCAVATYVYASPATIGDWPPGVVTLRATAPAAWAGLTAVIVVSETTVKLVAAVAVNATAVAPVNPVPVIVTTGPPNVDPVSGLTAVTAGATV